MLSVELVSLKKVRYGYDCRVSWFKLALHEYEYEIVILHNEEEVAVGPARHPTRTRNIQVRAQLSSKPTLTETWSER